MNIEEFAKQIGVSRTTITRAVHGTGRISPATREMVLERMNELGYRPNRVARALVTGRTNVVTLLTRSPYDPFYSKVIYGAGIEATRLGFDMIIKDTTADPDGTSKHSRLSGWPVDGILAVDCPLYVNSLVANNTASEIPVVSMGAFHHDLVDSVGVDLYSGAMAAFQHLRGLGCNRIAYLTVGAVTGMEKEPRLNAYSTFIEETGHSRELILALDESCAGARHAVMEYFKEHGRPDGLFCHTDLMAIGAFNAIRALEISVPGDLALIGCNGTDDAEFYNPTISTIVQPVSEMCRKAWEFLLNRIEDPSKPLQQAVLQPRFELRESSMR